MTRRRKRPLLRPAQGPRRPSSALPGAPAPWPPLLRGTISLADVRGALTSSASGQAPWTGSAAGPGLVVPAELPAPRGGGETGPAGVLCLLFEEGGEANVVLTRRTAHLRSHAGEVCFPGGRLGPGEAPLAAALRETREELGLEPSQVEVIGALSALSTRQSRSLVHCYVGAFPGPHLVPLRPHAPEVARVFWVRLSSLATEGAFHEELWPDEGPTARGAPVPTYRAIPFFNVGGEVVWGATGRLLFELLCLVLVGPNGAAREKVP
jgi:8-oxo-dGTP pyrophosphatase MutT (NUDIX family)